MEPNHPPEAHASREPGLPPGAVGAVVRRPDLWWTAVRQSLRLAEPGWWRHAPFLPLPSADYLRFRMVTAYGGEGVPGDDAGQDLVTYLEWCRTEPLGRR
jgi:hypothetical protein